MDLWLAVAKAVHHVGYEKKKSGLTAARAKRAKPKDKPYKISDRDGLYLLVDGQSLLLEKQGTG